MLIFSFLSFPRVPALKTLPRLRPLLYYAGILRQNLARNRVFAPALAP